MAIEIPYTMLLQFTNQEYHRKIMFCFLTQIIFNNHAHSGRIKTEIINDVGIYECKDWNVADTCKFSNFKKTLSKKD